MATKVKILTEEFSFELENTINNFIENKEVINISYQRKADIYSALITYKE
jgi:hypothetical protein